MNRLPFQSLDVYVVAKQFAERVHAAKIGDAELRDQATRAAKSTFLRLCEGLPNEGTAMRRKFFSLSNDSLHETVGAVDLSSSLGFMREEDAEVIHDLALRLRRMLRGLMHSR